MARENEREAIRNLQRYLRRLSYFNDEIEPAPIDGVFDSATESALRAFQAAQGIPVTGRADQESFERLFLAYTNENELRRAPTRIALFPQIPEAYTVELGNAQFLVSMIQHALAELAMVYEGLDDVPQSGVYDEATATAVRRFQALHGLPQSGGVDRTTWNALAEAYNRYFHSPYSEQ